MADLNDTLGQRIIEAARMAAASLPGCPPEVKRAGGYCTDLKREMPDVGQVSKLSGQFKLHFSICILHFSIHLSLSADSRLCWESSAS